MDLVIVPGQDVLIDTNGTSINSYVIDSAAGVFTGEPAENLGLFQEDTDFRVSGGFAFTLNGQHWLGNIIGSDWQMLVKGGPLDLYEDLSMTYTIQGAAGTYETRLIVIPEPGTLVMLIAGALLLLGYSYRARKRHV